MHHVYHHQPRHLAIQKRRMLLLHERRSLMAAIVKESCREEGVPRYT